MLQETLSLAMASDVAVIILMIAIFILYAVIRGTGLLHLLALSLPIAGFLYLVFPFKDTVISLFPEYLSSWGLLLIFLVFVLFALWALYRIIGPANGGKRAFQVVVTAVVLTLMIVFFSYHVVSLENLYNFGESFDAFFSSSTNFFWALTLALVALFVV